jgi:hypothetical protein
MSRIWYDEDGAPSTRGRIIVAVALVIFLIAVAVTS